MKLKKESEFRKEFTTFLSKYLTEKHYYTEEEYEDQDFYIDDDLVEEAIDAYEVKTGRKVCISNEK